MGIWAVVLLSLNLIIMAKQIETVAKKTIRKSDNIISQVTCELVS